MIVSCGLDPAIFPKNSSGEYMPVEFASGSEKGEVDIAYQGRYSQNASDDGKRGQHGIVAEVAVETSFPLSPIALGHALDVGLAECIEAVHEGDADVDFGGLAVGVS